MSLAFSAGLIVALALMLSVLTFPVKLPPDERVKVPMRAQRPALLHWTSALGANVQGVPGQAAVALAIALGRWRLGRGRREQGAAPRELGGAMAIRQKPNMADAVEAVGHGMQQEPPHELAGGAGKVNTTWK